MSLFMNYWSTEVLNLDCNSTLIYPVILSLFIDVKSIQVMSGFNLKSMNKKFCSILMVFQFLQFWLNLSAPTQQSGLQLGRTDFLTPLGARR